MNIFTYFTQKITHTIQTNASNWGLEDLTNITSITVEPPKDNKHGDIATNAALLLAKPNGQNPRELGQKIAEKLHDLDIVEQADIAGPGFVNLRISNHFWQQSVAKMLKSGPRFGKPNTGKNEIVNVEYVSTNPTGPLHIGHCRGAIVGDVIANILEFTGYNVVREYYVNDAGAQVDILARSVYIRYQQALGLTDLEIPEGLYPGDYLIAVATQLVEKYGDRFLNTDEDTYMPIFRDFAVEQMMSLIKKQLAEIGVEQSVFTSERKLIDSGKLEEAITLLTEKNLIYKGSLPKPKGKNDDNWQPVELTLFRSSEYGDDVDRPLFKSDGQHTYFASDIAYHFDKYQRGAKKQIDIWGADHGGYTKRMTAALKAISDNKAHLEIKTCQIVHLMDNGKMMKMSKRAGSFVTSSDVVKEVGKDVLRFMMLTRSADTQLEFDLTKAVEMSKDNPVFYVQYAHARTCSVQRQAREAFPDTNFADFPLHQDSLARLNESGELNLMRFLGKWPSIIDAASAKQEPHRIANYLYELAALLHAQWNKGNDDPSLRFVILDDIDLTLARFMLLSAVQNVIASGLTLFGVIPKESM